MFDVTVHNLLNMNVLKAQCHLDEDVVCKLFGKSVVALSYLIVIQISSVFVFSDDVSSFINHEVVDYPEHVIILLAGSLSIDLRDGVLKFFSLVHVNRNNFDDDL